MLINTRADLYSRHLTDKRKQLSLLLGRIDCDHLCQDIMPSPIDNGFRNRAKFRVFEKQDGVKIDGTDPCKGSVPFAEALWILPEWGIPVAEGVAAFIKESRRNYPVDGFELRLTHGRKQAHAVISVKRNTFQSFAKFAFELVAGVPGLVGVAIPSQKLEIGECFLIHSLHGKNFSAHYNSFFQSNLFLTPELVNRIISEAKGVDRRIIIDLYCGVGLLSLSAAAGSWKILGVDSDKNAVDSASNNAIRLGFKSYSFIHSSVEHFIGRAEALPESLVLLNPPRAGCAFSVIASVARMRPDSIILVSCYLETHIRDLKLWRDEDYEVCSIAAYDMFPFTPFLETVTLLKNKNQ